MARKLTDKQAVFVAEYLVDLNATQAAIRAGYSVKSAARIGVELLNKTQVREAIAANQAKRAQRVEITADRVVSELARIAFADPRDLMEWGPSGVKLKDSADLTKEQAASVAEVSETTTKDGGSLKLKKHDKVKALELLGRHMGMFKDKVETEVSGGLVITWQN